MPTAWIFEDDPDVATALRIGLEKASYTTQWFSNLADAKKAIAAIQHDDVVCLDGKMPLSESEREGDPTAGRQLCLAIRSRRLGCVVFWHSHTRFDGDIARLGGSDVSCLVINDMVKITLEKLRRITRSASYGKPGTVSWAEYANELAARAVQIDAPVHVVEQLRTLQQVLSSAALFEELCTLDADQDPGDEDQQRLAKEATSLNISNPYHTFRKQIGNVEPVITFLQEAVIPESVFHAMQAAESTVPLPTELVRSRDYASFSQKFRDAADTTVKLLTDQASETPEILSAVWRTVALVEYQHRKSDQLGRGRLSGLIHKFWHDVLYHGFVRTFSDVLEIHNETDDAAEIVDEFKRSWEMFEENKDIWRTFPAEAHTPQRLFDYLRREILPDRQLALQVPAIKQSAWFGWLQSCSEYQFDKHDPAGRYLTECRKVYASFADNLERARVALAENGAVAVVPESFSKDLTDAFRSAEKCIENLKLLQGMV